jgi:hypothetical protein
MEMKNLRNCRDCGARPGQVHKPHCSLEVCSICGGKRLRCQCLNHDRAFARWLGQSSAEIFSRTMGISMTEYTKMGGDRLFCVKPNVDAPRKRESLKLLPATRVGDSQSDPQCVDDASALRRRSGRSGTLPAAPWAAVMLKRLLPPSCSACESA